MNDPKTCNHNPKWTDVWGDSSDPTYCEVSVRCVLCGLKGSIKVDTTKLVWVTDEAAE